MEKVIQRLERICMAGAVLAVATMMLVTSYDALARYAFHAPVPWAFQLISYYLLIVAIYLAVAATFANGDHIAIDLFRHRFPDRVRAAIDLVWSLLATGVFALIAYGALAEMVHAYLQREFLPGYIVWPVWLAYLPIFVGTALTTLRLIDHACRLGASGTDPGVVVTGEHVE